MKACATVPIGLAILLSSSVAAGPQLCNGLGAGRVFECDIKWTQPQRDDQQPSCGIPEPGPLLLLGLGLIGVAFARRLR